MDTEGFAGAVGPAANTEGARSEMAGRLPERWSLTSWECSLAGAEIGTLERILHALPPAVLEAWFSADAGIREMAVLQTCQRMLIAVVSAGEAPAERLAGHLAELGAWVTRRHGEAVHHLFRVAGGFESIATGEREVCDQVRRSAAQVRSRAPRPLLRSLLVEAAEAASDPDSGATCSVADLAAEWVRGRLPAPGASVLVLGSGVVGRRVAEALAGSASVTVVYRRRPPDTEWARRWSVRLAGAPELPGLLREASVLVSSAKSAGQVLSSADVPEGGPRLFVDLGLPRNLDPTLGRRVGCELIDLARLPRRAGPVEGLAEREGRLVLAAEEALLQFDRASVEPWLAALYGEAERVRKEEIESALDFAGPLSSPARQAFERFSERLMRRLMAGPASEMRAVPAGPEHDARRQLLLERCRDSPEM